MKEGSAKVLPRILGHDQQKGKIFCSKQDSIEPANVCCGLSRYLYPEPSTLHPEPLNPRPQP